MANHSGVIDTGTHYQIVPNTRKITVPAAYKVIGTVGEHFAEQLTFMCPKLIDGHEVAGCARKYITWKNVNGDIGHDELRFLTEDEENLYFTWDVSNGLTVAKGVVSFSVHFEDVNVNNRIIYRWSTTECRECEILDSINAFLGKYEAVYVSGDTLVFADYNPVKDGVLSIDSNGLIPEGTLEITKNGAYDVGTYAAVEVEVDPPSGTMMIVQNGTYDVTKYAEARVELPVETPQIAVSEDGTIEATVSGVKSQVKLGSEHDSDFNADNIKKGVTIFGVEGVYEVIPTGSTQKITKNGTYDVGTVDTVEVAVPFNTPSISINASTGKVTASANGKTKTVNVTGYDSDLVAENIKPGINIFGVEGTYDPAPLIIGKIVDAHDRREDGVAGSFYEVGAEVHYISRENDNLESCWLDVFGNQQKNIFVCKNTLICIQPSWFTCDYESDGSLIGLPVTVKGRPRYCDITLSGGVELVSKAVDGSLFVVKVTESGFTITLI